MRPAVLFPVGLALAGLASCGPQAAPEAAAAEEEFAPVYKGIETRLLDEDLVEFLIEMEGARGIPDVEAYARCAAAQYTLIRGYGFARHLRTNVAERGGVWRGDAIYTISAALPRGLQTIDAEVTVRDCREQGIPTI
ncbi:MULTISPECIES: hypothetical protein [Cereibacter]|uniref:Lipoprotein n=1 Tax=Cereibacter johrii TaxID=445629 RepID=A0ABX5JDI2_9RHOB|nr:MULTISPECIES: hypothetical protein [Cereibacter]EKX57223.1 hypothetical protein D516_1818 [Rhodobacter sp. AKP1]RDS96401.1 hypothetical protein DWF04_10530 [Cereibacter sphaeroides f. sp. denitrificans]ACM00696.1 Hypothetical Protein RSKD131_0836 [Cereibacter sphaeroides KD131]MEA5162443.1 hypothetical protein [Cereibacter johrii]MWP37754.1 hypothetical protein [Cereibacter sphaeroides]